MKTYQLSIRLRRCKFLMIVVFLIDVILLVSTVKIVKNHVSSIRYCDICDLKFKRIVEFEKHIAGKRHQQQFNRTKSAADVWQEFISGAPHWAQDGNSSFVEKIWNENELSTLGLKYRMNSLHPSPVIKNLSPYQRARVWRYIRDAMGFSFYTEVANIIANVDCNVDGHLRVKEIFESFEVYKVLANFIVAAQRTITDMDTPGRKVEKIVEFACGHGLVGILLAYRFPNLQVYLYDLQQRPTYAAFLESFEAHGFRRPGESKVLPNVNSFCEADLRTCSKVLKNSIVVCIHGCGDVNQDTIDMAIDSGAAGWAVMPCCIKKEMYLGEACSVQLSSCAAHNEHDDRYSLLCGAMAHKYSAQLVSAIDPRITNRHIVIAGGVGTQASQSGAEEICNPTAESSQEIEAAAKWRRLPKLKLS